MVILFLRILAIIGIVTTVSLLAIYFKKNKDNDKLQDNLAYGKKHVIYNSILALVANFLDVEGIGTHAVNAIGFKMGRSVEDSNIPGTMNVGAAVPCCLAAFLFYPISRVDGVTIILLIIPAVIGAFAMSGVIGKMNLLGVRLLMGTGLVIMSIFMFVKGFSLGNVDFECNSIALTGGQLVIAMICSLIFGGLMNIGVGYYAPMIAILSMLGLDVTSSLTIVFGATSMLLAFGNAPMLIKIGKFDMVTVITQLFLGSLGVVAAYMLQKHLPIHIMTIVIAMAVLVTGFSFLKDFAKGQRAVNR